MYTWTFIQWFNITYICSINVFDDDADTPITAGAPPFTGSFQPEGDLNDFNGDMSNGLWTITVSDTFGALDGGIINSLSIEVCGTRDPNDFDSDGILNDDDNCVIVDNTDQADNDGDGEGDECDPDDDNDGVLDVNDNCQFEANADQADNDGDGEGDVCDPDDDNDGVLDEDDNCQFTANSDQADVDFNGIGDVCDNCRNVSNRRQRDTDLDNIGNYKIKKLKNINKIKN